MSNIVLKGDVIQDLGEYLPNVYIEGIQVVQALPVERPEQIELNIHCSVLFLVSDDYDVADLTTTIQQVSIHALILSSAGKQLKKQTIINRISLGSTTNDEIYTLDNGDTISDRIASGDYQDDLYDEKDRRIVKVSFYRTVLVDVDEGIERGNVYLYVFSSIFGKTKISETSSNLVYLNTSNIAYEKLFSPGLNVLREEEVIYVGSQGEKYGQVPILGLNRNFYKTQNVTREDIISKVNALVKRFEGRTIGPLSDSVDSIKNVLSKEADTENLLVQLDKVRRSFPNKTNNNPVGNLYAAFAVLLRNINSAFRPADIVKKEKYLTGKVIDLRTGLTFSNSVSISNDEIDYIPEDMFFIHRERISTDEESDLSANKGAFFIRYEEMLKRETNISKVLNIEKLLEATSSQDSNDLRRILFSYFRIYTLTLTRFFKDRVFPMYYHTLTYGIERDNRSQFPDRSFMPLLNQEAIERSSDPVATSLFTEFNFGFKNPEERLLGFQFRDLDTFTGTFELFEIENEGSMRFRYNVRALFYDETQNFVLKLIQKFEKIYNDLILYTELANEVCSYNNIDNKFNDFFANSIRDQYTSGEFPWETAPAIYTLMAYILTDDPDSPTFEDAVRFSKNISSTISPENGTLSSLNQFKENMEELKLQQVGNLKLLVGSVGAYGQSHTIPASMVDKECLLRPFNYEDLESEADAEFRSLISSNNIRVYRTEDVITPEAFPVTSAGNTDRGGTFFYYSRLFFGIMNCFKEFCSFPVDGYGREGADQRLNPIQYLNEAVSTLSATTARVVNYKVYAEFSNAIQALSDLFKPKRDDMLRQYGLGFSFAYGESGTRMVDIPEVKEIYDRLRDNLQGILRLNLSSGEYKFYLEVGGQLQGFTNEFNAIVNDVLNYYRLNTDQLMTDINLIDTVVMVSQAGADNDWTAFGQGMVSAANEGFSDLHVPSSYTGPEANEIANFEDISF